MNTFYAVDYKEVKRSRIPNFVRAEIPDEKGIHGGA